MKHEGTKFFCSVHARIRIETRRHEGAKARRHEVFFIKKDATVWEKLQTF
jgi:hypothetical protein